MYSITPSLGMSFGAQMFQIWWGEPISFSFAVHALMAGLEIHHQIQGRKNLPHPTFLLDFSGLNFYIQSVWSILRFIYLFVLVLRDGVFLCSPDCPGTFWVNQASLSGVGRDKWRKVGVASLGLDMGVSRDGLLRAAEDTGGHFQSCRNTAVFGWCRIKDRLSGTAKMIWNTKCISLIHGANHYDNIHIQ